MADQQTPHETNQLNKTNQANQLNKANVQTFWQALDKADVGQLQEVVAEACAPDVAWHGPAPIGDIDGAAAWVDEFWVPFRESFTSLRRETHLFFGGVSNGRRDGDMSKDGQTWVTGTGLFHATFDHDWLGIPATKSEVAIRWGDFSRVVDGRIVEVFFLVDVVDLMAQAGVSVLPPERGTPHLYPPPAAADGHHEEPASTAVTEHSLDHIRAFIFDGLNAFDQSDLASMGMADWFHPNVAWYGPGGIGACLSFQEFEELHQAPWLVAFPDRQVQDLDALFAEGMYSGAPGWSGVIARHTGQYLDVDATGNAIEFNGLDWWKRDGERYIENWVFVDMVHLFDQFGVDLFQRMRDQLA